MTPYSDIYKRFSKRIEDVELVKYTPQEQEELLLGWLDTALMHIELQGISLQSNLSDRDDDLLEFNDDLTNSEKEIIALFMVVAWYEPKINSLEHTLMFVGASGEKWTSQKEHLNSMTLSRDYAKDEIRKLCVSYDLRNNSYLKGSH